MEKKPKNIQSILSDEGFSLASKEWEREEEAKVANIKRKENPTSDEKRYVILNETFRMMFLNSMYDGERELLTFYFYNAPEDTINGYYRKFVKSRHSPTNEESGRIYELARRAYNER